MKNIISYFSSKSLEDYTKLFLNNSSVTFSGGGNSSSKAMVVSEFLRHKDYENKPFIWIVSSESEKNTVINSLNIWGKTPVYTYKHIPSDQISKYGTMSALRKARNLDSNVFVNRLHSGNPGVFVLEVNDVFGEFPNFQRLQKNQVQFYRDQDFNTVTWVQKFVSMGYELAPDSTLERGQYLMKGDTIYIYPVNSEHVLCLSGGFDSLEKISLVDADFNSIKEFAEFTVLPVKFSDKVEGLNNCLPLNAVVIDDEVDVMDEDYSKWNKFLESVSAFKNIIFASFNDDTPNHMHLHFMSIFKYRTAYDFANDLRDKINQKWNTLIFTKHLPEVKALLRDQSIPFLEGLNKDNFNKTSIFLLDVDQNDTFPQSFQAPVQKVCIVTDVDISFLKESRKKDKGQNIFNDFLTSLKAGDYVVHADHGIAKFLGLEQKTVDSVTKEYLKLGYAENDKLYVPIDQADKVNKYIGSEELMPKLTRLGSADWNTLTSKVKKETQKIAKELLKLYAQRKAAKGFVYNEDDKDQLKFEASFPYDETPGQIKAINDVKHDMEREQPMDRLVCGDVGFGKTEVAMRAAFKAVKSGKQVAVISPITILADQHYKSFHERMKPFNIRVEMLSRFRTAKQQKAIVEKLKKGEIDVIVGTHRLIQPDIEFKNLGLVIIDEEQRFGVKQKEKLKELRNEVDIFNFNCYANSSYFKYLFK